MRITLDQKSRRCERGLSIGTMALALAFLVAIYQITAHAQSISGALHGTVTDSSGAVIPGAAIEVRNLANAQIRTATTDRRGYYTVADLAPGEYSVTISSYGFTTPTGTRLR